MKCPTCGEYRAECSCEHDLIDDNDYGDRYGDYGDQE